MISCVYLSAQSKLAKKVGLKFFVIYARLEDVSGKTFVTGLNHNQVNLHTKRNADCFYFASDKAVLLQCSRAIEYYAGNTLSIEIVKENHLQKIYFPFSKQKRVSNEINSSFVASLRW